MTTIRRRVGREAPNPITEAAHFERIYGRTPQTEGVRPTRFFLDESDWDVCSDDGADDGFLIPSQSSLVIEPFTPPWDEYSEPHFSFSDENNIELNKISLKLLDSNLSELKIKTKTKKGVDEMKSRHVMSEFIPGTKVCFNPEHTDYHAFLKHLNNTTTGIVLKSYNDSQVTVIFRTGNERVQSLDVNISALLIIDEPLTKVLKYIIDNKSFFTLSAKEENELMEKIVKKRLLVSSVTAFN